MKISIAQINPIVGDILGNCNKILDYTNQAKQKSCDLVVFPEMAITGYPPKDLLEQPSFITKNLNALQELSSKILDISIIVGFVDRNNKSEGKPLYNASALIHNGKIIGINYKSLLPTYDVFDEDRYFEPADSIFVHELNGVNLGISICEDIWNQENIMPRKLYHSDPINVLVNKGANLLINISASPYILEKEELREKLIRSKSTKYKLPLIYVNQVGGNDELVFDGNSIAVDSQGNVIARAKDFEEDMVIVNMEKNTGDIHPTSLSNMEKLHKALVLGLKDYVLKCGFKKVVLGLSGGIDSAVTACIAASAIGKENVWGISLPSRYSSEGSLTDAEKLAKNLGINYKVVSIDKVYQSYLDTLAEPFAGREMDVTEENIQARIRGSILMAFSNKFGYLLLSTGNKSEVATGYCTLYGDMCGGLSVISDVPKTMIYELANYINREREIIPRNTITKPPSAELRPNQKDQDTLPPYDVLDAILKAYIEESKEIDEIVALGHNKEIVEKVVRMINTSEYKRRQSAPGIKVTSKAFGFGRRMPIAAKL